MLTNININKMNQLTSENETAKQIVSQLLENHQTIVSMISHEIRNPLTLVSSALQIIEIQHPEVINFHGWSQAIEDIEFMCNLLNGHFQISTTEVRCTTLSFHWKNFSKILPFPLQCHLIR